MAVQGGEEGWSCLPTWHAYIHVLYVKSLYFHIQNSLVYSLTHMDCIILAGFLLPLIFFELIQWVGGVWCG